MLRGDISIYCSTLLLDLHKYKHHMYCLARRRPRRRGNKPRQRARILTLTVIRTTDTMLRGDISTFTYIHTTHVLPREAEAEAARQQAEAESEDTDTNSDTDNRHHAER
ncbi:unnamed protein product [Plutella xylostella]|uniref:(diamondback moth) hypothetical protein n=1 Tax=Plutella xylostella TaxID=51655 RepID=A0A8S4FPF8_PLUXY|nr:unnamed protein product [Plutella xylostella]